MNLYQAEKTIETCASIQLAEHQLVEEARSGSSNAFAELFERHRLRIFRTTLKILRNREDAEDVVQQTFQRAFTNLAAFRAECAFFTWLSRIAINEALMLIRRRRPTSSLSGQGTTSDQESWELELTDDSPTPEEAAVRNEFHQFMVQAIAQLHESLRVVAIFRELHGHSSAETARHLGLSKSAVKSRSVRARRELRRCLTRKFNVAARTA